MKKALYTIVLAVEFLVGFYVLAMATSLLGWAFFGTVTAVWAALMVWQIIMLKKAVEIKAKRKAKFLVALIMLLPAVAAFVGILVVGYMYF